MRMTCVWFKIKLGDMCDSGVCDGDVCDGDICDGNVCGGVCDGNDVNLLCSLQTKFADYGHWTSAVDTYSLDDFLQVSSPWKIQAVKAGRGAVDDRTIIVSRGWHGDDPVIMKIRDWGLSQSTRL